MDDKLFLKDLLTANRIKVKVSVDNWQDAIREVGRLLVNDGTIENRFIDAMIRVACEFGPYIVIAPGLAMPHARPEDGCIRTSLGLITLTNPIPFGNEDNDPVKVVLALAAKDNKSHIQGLSELATLMSRDNVINDIFNANSIQEILDIVNNDQ